MSIFQAIQFHERTRQKYRYLIVCITVYFLPFLLLANDRDEIPDLNEVAKIISDNHIDSPAQGYVEKGIKNSTTLNDYLSQLDDYSHYKTPKETIFSRSRNQYKRIGIGVNYLFKKPFLLAVPVNNAPAYHDGFVVPSYLKTINGNKIYFDDFNSYAFLAELTRGDVVNLTTYSRLTGDDEHYTIMTEAFTDKGITMLQFDHYHYLRIEKFRAPIIAKARAFIASMKPDQHLLIDLRYSPGGDVYVMADFLSLLMEEDQAVAVLKGRSGTSDVTLVTLNGKILPKDTLITVFVSGFSASSAELFARALKNKYRKTRVIGMPTKGKCLAQTGFPLSNGGTLILTTNRVLDVNGVDCEGKPIQPDNVVNTIELYSVEELLKLL